MANNIYDSDDDGSIAGTSGADTIYGGTTNDTADGGGSLNDTIDGGQSDDVIFGGEGDDLLFGGDAGDAAGGGTANAKTVESFQFDIDKATSVSTGSGPGHIGDSITYNNIATATDGSSISVRITVKDQSDPDLEIILGYNDDYPIIVNSGNDNSMNGETLDLQIEFLDASGDPVTIDSNFTFRDIDNNGSWGNEGITFDTTDITSYAVSDDPATSVVVDDRGDEIEFTSNGAGGVSDENLWTQVFFEGQSSLNFTLESRAHNAGYGFNTADFSDPPIITEVDASGDDLLYGGTGNDSAIGGGGDDTLYGEDGDDTLDGSDGDDTLFGGEGDDAMSGGEGADTYFGGAGQDTVDYSGSSSGITVDLSNGQVSGGQAEGDSLSGIDGIVGSDHDDSISGYDGQGTGANQFTNVFYGGEGDDQLDGKGGDDSLFGGDDEDSILGGTGDDYIDGGSDADSIDAGDGNDSVLGGGGQDEIEAGAGDDTIDAGSGQDTVYGGSGDDSIAGGKGADLIHAGDDDDSIDGGDASDTIYGGSGNDRIDGGDGANSLFGGDGNDVFIFDGVGDGDLIRGGDGSDTLDASDYSGSVTITLGATNTVDGGGETSDFQEVENIILTEQDDTVIGGGDEAISIDGAGGDDQIAGSSASDTLSGGTGNDTLDGGSGSDTLAGGDGADVFVVRSADFSDLGTEDEITAAILDQNAADIEGWQGIKGGAPTDADASNGNVFDVPDIGKDVDYALRFTMGKSRAGEIEKQVEDLLEDYIDANQGQNISAKDLSDLTYETLEPEIGWFNAGIASLKVYGTARDQIEAASSGDVADIDIDAIVDDVVSALEPEVGQSEADAVRTNLVEEIEKELDKANDGIISAQDIGDAVHKVVKEEFDKDLADSVETVAIDTAHDQLTGATDASIGDQIIDRASHDVIEDFELGTDSLDLSNVTYLGDQGLSTNDVKITDTAGDGTGDAVLNLPDGSTITLQGVSVYDLDPEALETMGFNASSDATQFQNAFLTDAGQIAGGGGDDAISGSSASETISGGSGSDTLIAGGGQDSISGGDDRDQIVISDDLSGLTVDGGEGGDDYDTLDFTDVSSGVKIVSTGNESGTFEAYDEGSSASQSGPPGGPPSDPAGASQPPSTFSAIESFSGSSSNDSFDFTAHGEDVDVSTGSGNDTLDGSAYDDVLNSGSDDDTVDGGGGNDSISSGSGNDTVTAGSGNDSISGGSGNDMFVLSDSGGDDTVTDFESGDQIDTGALDDGSGGMVTAEEVVVTGGGGSDQMLTFPNGETLTVPDGTVDTATPAAQFASLVAMGVPPCFAPGTMILTPTGERAIETLAVGDLVTTADNGPQPVRWIGRRDQDIEGPDDDTNMPVQIGARTISPALPRRDLITSPQHRMLLSGPDVLEMFQVDAVLAPAKSLTKMKGIRRMRGKRKVTYIALLFDRHEVIFAEGAPAESFRPGPMAMQGFQLEVRKAIYSIYTRLLDDPEGGLGPPARRLLTAKEGKQLAKVRASSGSTTDAV